MRALALALVALIATASLSFVAWAVHGALALEEGVAVARPARDTVGYPRTVRLGDVEFTLHARPMRIVAGTARAIDYLAALCAPERIVGFPEQAIEYATLDADVEAALAGAKRFHAYVAEPVLRLEPDLVVADLWQSADTHARLREAGVPLLVLPDSLDWPAARATLLALGEWVGEEQRARDVAADLDARVARLRAAADARPRRLRAVPYSNFGAKGFSAGSGTSVHEILELAGLVNAVAADGGVGHVDMTFEQLLRLDPDVIVVSEPLDVPAGHTGDRGGASGELLRTTPGLESLRAVREDRIVALPAGLYATASHRLVRAAEVLAERVAALEGAR